MKKNKLVAFTAAGLLLASFGGVKALAYDDETKVGDSKQTETLVIIEDQNNSDTDPIQPDRIQLVHVPSNFQFNTALKNGHYEIKGGTVYDTTLNDHNIRVFSDSSLRSWSVKANIKKINRLYDNFEIESPTLTIDNVVLKTGADSTVHSYIPGNDESPENGIHDKLVQNINIEFDDAKHELNKDDVLAGDVIYTLYATPIAFN